MCIIAYVTWNILQKPLEEILKWICTRKEFKKKYDLYIDHTVNEKNTMGIIITILYLSKKIKSLSLSLSFSRKT